MNVPVSSKTWPELQRRHTVRPLPPLPTTLKSSCRDNTHWTENPSLHLARLEIHVPIDSSNSTTISRSCACQIATSCSATLFQLQSSCLFRSAVWPLLKTSAAVLTRTFHLDIDIAAMDRSTTFLLVCLVGLVLFASPAAAFGAGNIASISKIEGHNCKSNLGTLWRKGIG